MSAWFDHSEKVILVTGGGRGLGEALCLSLAETGATIAVGDVRRESALDVASKINSKGGKAVAVALDVCDEGTIDSAIEQIVNEWGRLDVLINNAGVDMTVPVEELDVKDWDRILATNLRGPFIMSKRVLPHMRKKGEGHIINIVSTAAKRAWPNASAYHASKWGLLGFSHALHSEARQENVKVTAVVCGGMRTPFLLERFPDIDLNTLQDPMDVAHTVRFLLSAPKGTVIPEIMTIPMKETSWP